MPPKVKPAQLGLAAVEDAARSAPPVAAGAGITVNGIAARTRVDRRTLKKIIEDAGVEPIGVESLGNRQSPTYDPAIILPVVERWQASHGQASRAEDENDYNGHGSPFKWKAHEEAIRLSRLNEIETRLAEGRYMESDQVKAIFSTFCAALDGLPKKLKSECGLTHQQLTRATQLMDEARQNAAQGILKIKV